MSDQYEYAILDGRAASGEMVSLDFLVETLGPADGVTDDESAIAYLRRNYAGMDYVVAKFQRGNDNGERVWAGDDLPAPQGPGPQAQEGR